MEEDDQPQPDDGPEPPQGSSDPPEGKKPRARILRSSPRPFTNDVASNVPDSPPDQQAPSGRDGDSDGAATDASSPEPPAPPSFLVPRTRRAAPRVEASEIVHGHKPGDRFARLTRQRELRFERGAGEGTLRATRIAEAPRTFSGHVWRGIKRVVIGAPLASSRLAEEKLSKVKALPIFASDALSSTAYATEEILIVLVLAGSGALGYSIPISIAIAALLIIVATSYRQTIRAYPQGCGAYKVALDNLGVAPGLVAGASLVVDYTLTVAVSTAAGVAAITSAVPELHDERVILAVVFVALLTVGNLRGVRESGTMFAIPTYFFLVTFGIMIVTGLVRLAIGDIDHVPHEESLPFGNESLAGAAGLFLLFRAFSSGATALTGIEAISNGVPAFKEPSPRNAATTLTWMAVILTALFVSLTVLAHQIEVYPSETKTVVAQIGDAVFGGGPLFYTVQVATALILVLAANTSFAGLPALGSVMAKDAYIPKLFADRGDRLGYSNGILLLAVASAGLLVLFGADTHRLIPLYALGVFVGFTLSQAGMVMYWRKHPDRGAQRATAINAVGAVATGIVSVIIAATKFSHGAWITIAAIIVLALLFSRIGQHYRTVKAQLDIRDDELFGVLGAGRRGQAVLLPIDDVNRATMRAVAYARSISNNVTAVHVTDDAEEGEAVRQHWERLVLDVPIVILESEYRSLSGPVLAYVDALDRRDEGQVVTVVLPEYVARWPWQRILHNQSAVRLKKALLDRPNTVVIDVPYHLRQPAPTTM